ncbi:transposable element Tcb1 transposase [Trichonephila clavipes]|nr:transposable element Tcb1 transposase [Trichonephila clavipes]
MQIERFSKTATAHKANKTHEWCKANFPDRISSEEWPTYTPVLNPIPYTRWIFSGIRARTPDSSEKNASHKLVTLSSRLPWLRIDPLTPHKTTSGCFYPRSNHWEIGGVTSVAAEFGIAHSIVSRLWRQFQTTGTAIRGFSSGRPRGTTPADDQYIVLQARRNRRQTAGEIARHTTQVTGRPISRFTVARRLHDGGLFARRPVRCIPLTPAHRRRHSLRCAEHRNWRDNGDEYSLQMRADSV